MTIKEFFNNHASKKWLFIAIVLLLAVLALLVVTEDSADVETQTSPSYLSEVSVISIVAGNHQGHIAVFAELNSRWRTTINAHVSGEITEITSGASAGAQIQKGQTLLRIESSVYQAQVDEAEQLLAEAEIQLQQEKQRSEQAEINWQHSGITTPPSELALNRPQLKLAERTVQAATSRVNATKTQLAYTRVIAPFSGYVAQRHVSLGQTLSEGDPLLDILGSNTQEITVSLAETQWRLINKNGAHSNTTLHSDNGVQIGTATITHGGDFVDSATRQYSLYLTVDPVDKPVPVGSFVQIRLPSVVVSNSLKIPAGSLTREGYVWTVNEDQQLQRFRAEVLFYQDDWVIVHQPEPASANWQVATLPLASFLPGTKVQPIQATPQINSVVPQ